MAMLEGFTGDARGVTRHIDEAQEIADAFASPELQAMTAEIAIEHASVGGRWDEALALAERTIPVARATMPNPLLPRLLVWTGLIVLARDDMQRANTLLVEAWALSSADTHDDPGDDGLRGFENAHNVILAHTGMGALYLAQSDWHRALGYLERGLALADRFGYVAWAIHRLLPLIIEARLRVHDHARAEALTARLIAAADALDAVPFVFHGAKLRRNAAQVLEADGDMAGAVRELRRAHDVFLRLGAEFELRGACNQLRALGVRLPPRTAVQGAGTLTARQLLRSRGRALRIGQMTYQGVGDDVERRTREFD